MAAQKHDFDDDVVAALDLVAQIRPILAGNPPDMIGAALADLTSMFFAGHHPAVRSAVMKHWLAAMQKLISSNEQIILDRYGGKWPRRQ